MIFNVRTWTRMRAPVAATLLAIFMAPSLAVGQSVEESDFDEIQGDETPGSDSEQPGIDDLAAVSDSIRRATNSFRESEDLAAVSANASLSEAAGEFAKYMAERDVYGHNADGKRPSQRAQESGYDYCVVLENIAYQYRSTGFTPEELAKRFFEGWQESPGHRRNMLDPDVTETGVGIARSESTGHYYAVQMFGRPRSAAVSFQIKNQSSQEAAYRVGDQEFTLPPRYSRTHRRCRQAELDFVDDEDSGESPVVPEEGDRFIIRPSEGERILVERE